jgi:hypothetical protein
VLGFNKTVESNMRNGYTWIIGKKCRNGGAVLRDKIKQYLLAGYPAIWIQDWEEERVCKDLQRIAREGKEWRDISQLQQLILANVVTIITQIPIVHKHTKL